MINGKIIKKALIGTLIFGVGFVSGIIAEKKKMNAEFEALQNEYHEKKKKERKEKEVKEAYEEVANEYTNPADSTEEEKTESDNSEETSSDEDDEDDEPIYLTNLGSYVEDPDDFDDDEETESDDETEYEEINGVMQISEEMFLENKWDYEVEDYHVWTNLRVTDHFNTLVWQDDLDDKFGAIIDTFVGEHLYLVNHRLERVYDIKYETLDYQMNDEDDRDWK